jgi:hypothetical protein
MAKAKKTETAEVQDSGILKLIGYDPSLIDDLKGCPNYMLDEYVSVFVDANGNHELHKIKQTTVSDTNIKTATNVYGDKYQIGDTYQEWVSMTKYLSSPLEAARCYAKLIQLNEISKLKYCKDIGKLVQIEEKINNALEKFAINETLPEVMKQVNTAYNTLRQYERDIEQYKQTRETITKEANELLALIKEKRSIIVDNLPKQKQHRIKLED